MKTKLVIEADSLEEIQMYAHAVDFGVTLVDLDNACRNYIKHGHDFESIEGVLEWVRDQIREEVNLVH